VHSLKGCLLRVLDVLLVVGVTAENRTVPATEGEENLRVGIRHPSQDGSIVLLGLAQKGGLLVLRSHCFKVSI
jgi:hypothetical protein